MGKVLLIHNPTAGDEAHSKEELVSQLIAAGWEVDYHSAKKDSWKKADTKADIIAVAGGDGTIGKVARHLLKEADSNATPIGVLPLGTANNIAKTFNANPDTAAAIAAWHGATVQHVDAGKVTNVPDMSYFIEGMGFGIFPYLMEYMKENEREYESPEAELAEALKQMHRILWEYEPRHCHLEIDGTDHSGKFYMVEVMNIKSIGPNVMLSPLADPGDGEFEVVLIPEAQREKFSEYLEGRMEAETEAYHFHTLKGKKININWGGTRIHVDDKMVQLEKGIDVSIELVPGALSFLVPQNPSE
ncbi:diacylglycerol/lipid kinase family protein [Pseudocnuella soli]|uniref:diacylglycerol/lipid kinase family protein n=1 Tax=Pseudocnuella soli TaxID=2502779 RepID=UPI0014043843|nr:diacylglycerol kinase family protein [Pseudocnuella soli]